MIIPCYPEYPLIESLDEHMIAFFRCRSFRPRPFSRSAMQHGAGFLLGVIISVPATAQSPLPPLDPAQSRLCRNATEQVERALRLPDGFLSAISRVETGRPDGAGNLTSWPWSINAAGTSHYYASRQEAVEAVKGFQQQGIESIDVGCLQVNLLHHPAAFPSLDMAFDPYSNARYAGLFLQKLKEQTGSWPRAAAAYHSQTGTLGTPYMQQVLQQWATPLDIPQPHTSLLTPPHPATTMPVAVTHANVSQNHPARITVPYRPFVIQSASSLPSGIKPSGGGITHATNGPANFLAALRYQETTQPLSPAGQPATSTTPGQNTPQGHHPFRPFRGYFRPAMPPPPHQRMKSSQNGRSLATYRAMPVHTVSPMPYAPAY